MRMSWRRLRVTAGFVMVAAFAWFSHPTPHSLAIGLACVCAADWRCAPGPRDTSPRISAWPPRALTAFTRNPLYLGTLLTALGLAAAGTQRRGWRILFGVLFALVYLPAIELEEQHLSAIMPGYSAYAARVPLLLPRWPDGLGRESFSLALYKKNREYQAALGWLVGAAWLLARAIWLP